MAEGDPVKRFIMESYRWADSYRYYLARKSTLEIRTFMHRFVDVQLQRQPHSLEWKALKVLCDEELDLRQAEVLEYPEV
jgi:hypothetical protein